MKSFCAGVIAGILVCIFFVAGGSAYAEGSSKVDVFFRNIKIMIDGAEKKSDEGKVFLYENLTYVPLRFVGESLGKEVGWNEESQTIWIGTQESNKKEQAEQATKIIKHGLENADTLQSYSMKVKSSTLVGSEGFKIGVETGLDASVIRKPDKIISGERSVSLFGKPISGRYYFANDKLYTFFNKWSESNESLSSIFSHDTFDPHQVLKGFLSSPEPIRIESTPEGTVLQTGGSGENWKSYALDFFPDSDKLAEEELSVREMTFKLLVDRETSLPVRLEVISDIEELEDDEPTGYKSTVIVSYTQLNKLQSIPVPEGLQTSSSTSPLSETVPLKKTPTISEFEQSTEVFPPRYLISGGIGKGKYGFLDQNGKVVIEPKYTMAIPFSEGLAPVLLNGKWGYIDVDGHMVIQPRYDWAFSFSNGLAHVQDEHAKRGYINRLGNIVIPIQYENADEFSEGLALVKYKGKSGYINTKGEFVISPQYEKATRFSEGLAAVSVMYGYPVEYIDRTGQTIIQDAFEIPSQYFQEGLAPVSLDGKWGYINAKGEKVIPPQYESAGHFSGELAAVSLDGKYGYINENGDFDILPQFKWATTFSEGLAVVQTMDGKRGYIDQTGKLITEDKYTLAFPFTNGLALVQEKDADGSTFEGYIDRNGTYVYRVKLK